MMEKFRVGKNVTYLQFDETCCVIKKLYFLCNLIKNISHAGFRWSPWEQLKHKWCETGNGIQLLADYIDSIYL